MAGFHHFKQRINSVYDGEFYFIQKYWDDHKKLNMASIIK